MKDTMIIKIIQIEFIKMIESWNWQNRLHLIGEWRHRLDGTLVRKGQKIRRERGREKEKFGTFMHGGETQW